MDNHEFTPSYGVALDIETADSHAHTDCCKASINFDYLPALWDQQHPPRCEWISLSIAAASYQMWYTIEGNTTLFDVISESHLLTPNAPKPALSEEVYGIRFPEWCSDLKIKVVVLAVDEKGR